MESITHPAPPDSLPENLKEKLRLFEQAIGQSSCGITLADARRPDCPLVYINEAFVRITGYEAHETLGYNCRFLQRDDRNQPGVQKLREAIRARRACKTLLKNYRKDGTPFWNELHVAPVFDGATGEATHFIGIQTDVTARVEAELQRDQLNSMLETSNQQLSSALRVRDDFISHISHELRTPLNAVLGFSQLLGDPHFGPMTDKQSEFLRQIQAAGQHLLDLINDILDSQRIRAGRMQINQQSFALQEWIEPALSLVRGDIERKSQELRVEITPGFNRLRGDLCKCRQVLINLLSNAVKYTPEHGRITVRVRRIDADKLELVVEDTGIGIQPENLPRIFDSFFQENRLEQPMSSGVGLALTKLLVDLQGGSISVESRPGAGSTFSVRMPIADDASTLVSPEPVATPAEPPPAEAMQRPLVLIADDDSANRSLYADILATRDCDVIACADGNDVVRLALEQRPSLIMLDLNMPGRGGLETIRALHEIPALGAIPAIAVTGDHGPEVEARCKAAGFRACLFKPFRIEIMLNLVGEYLASSPVAGSSAA